jgi:hypothetical protein
MIFTGTILQIKIGVEKVSDYMYFKESLRYLPSLLIQNILIILQNLRKAFGERDSRSLEIKVGLINT